MRGYQFQVMAIDYGSPAYRVLELSDFITGVDGQVFGPDVDPRIAFGKAIEKAGNIGLALL